MPLPLRLCHLFIPPFFSKYLWNIIQQKIWDELPLFGIVEFAADCDELLVPVIGMDDRADMTITPLYTPLVLAVFLQCEPGFFAILPVSGFFLRSP